MANITVHIREISRFTATLSDIMKIIFKLCYIKEFYMKIYALNKKNYGQSSD